MYGNQYSMCYSLSFCVNENDTPVFIQEPYAELMCLEEPCATNIDIWKAWVNERSKKPSIGYSFTFCYSTKKWFEIPSARTRNEKRPSGSDNNNPAKTQKFGSIGNFTQLTSQNNQNINTAQTNQNMQNINTAQVNGSHLNMPQTSRPLYSQQHNQIIQQSQLNNHAIMNQQNNPNSHLPYNPEYPSAGQNISC